MATPTDKEIGEAINATKEDIVDMQKQIDTVRQVLDDFKKQTDMISVTINKFKDLHRAMDVAEECLADFEAALSSAIIPEDAELIDDHKEALDVLRSPLETPDGPMSIADLMASLNLQCEQHNGLIGNNDLVAVEIQLHEIRSSYSRLAAENPASTLGAKQRKECTMFLRSWVSPNPHNSGILRLRFAIHLEIDKPEGAAMSATIPDTLSYEGLMKRCFPVVYIDREPEDGGVTLSDVYIMSFGLEYLESIRRKCTNMFLEDKEGELEGFHWVVALVRGIM
ncbi:MAG: hypothetical protein M1829_004738 [Trizodia sp. TS-e1964]|nr:MAG: hypothetical protein M1829_004738 [Trizodia sp. TS-e1964]